MKKGEPSRKKYIKERREYRTWFERKRERDMNKKKRQGQE